MTRLKGDTWRFMTKYIYTHDTDDQVHPYKLFPNSKELEVHDRIFNYELSLGKRWFFIAKSRRMKMTLWALSRLIHKAVFFGGQELYCQSRKLAAARKLIRKAWGSVKKLPPWMTGNLHPKATFGIEPTIAFTNGSFIMGIPEGREAIRGEGSPLVVSDELGFQANFLESFAAIKPAVGSTGVFIGLTTANGTNEAYQIYADKEMVGAA